VDVGVPFAELADQRRQQVNDRGLARGDDHLAAVQVALHLAVEAHVQRFQAIDQGPGHFVEFLAFAGHVDARAVAFEQHGVQFPLQRADLQADGRLAEKQLFGGIGHLAALGHGAKSTQLLELVSLIIEAW
jgi:hypothetical protein